MAATSFTKENIVDFNWHIPEWFPNLDSVVSDKLKKFCSLILSNNFNFSLVSAKVLPVTDLLFFSDCIIGSQIIYENFNSSEVIYDFGTGIGFPGIIFAILYPAKSLILVENDVKKVEFLKFALKELELSNVKLISTSIELLPVDSVYVGISRSLGNLSKSLLMTRKVFKKFGTFYHIKSEQWGLELSEIPIQLCSIWTPELVSEYKLPSTNIKCAVVKTIKI